MSTEKPLVRIARVRVFGYRHLTPGQARPILEREGFDLENSFNHYLLHNRTHSGDDVTDYTAIHVSASWSGGSSDFRKFYYEDPDAAANERLMKLAKIYMDDCTAPFWALTDADGYERVKHAFEEIGCSVEDAKQIV
jgi:hypothetical protein